MVDETGQTRVSDGVLQGTLQLPRILVFLNRVTEETLKESLRQPDGRYLLHGCELVFPKRPEPIALNPGHRSMDTSDKFIAQYAARTDRAIDGILVRAGHEGEGYKILGPLQMAGFQGEIAFQRHGEPTDDDHALVHDLNAALTGNRQKVVGIYAKENLLQDDPSSAIVALREAIMKDRGQQQGMGL